MSIEQLKIIAEIIGGLEQTGTTGFIWYLLAEFATNLLPFIVLMVLVILAFVIAKKLLAQNKKDQWLVSLGTLLDEDVTENVCHMEYQRMVRGIETLQSARIRSQEREEIATGNLKQLQAEYENLYREWEAQQDTIRLQDAAIRELADVQEEPRETES